jgi:TRAP-type C4-dicarboxylate transport system substrate-binding protein
MLFPKKIFSVGLLICGMLTIGIIPGFVQEKIPLSMVHIGPAASPAILGTLVPLKEALEKTGEVEVTMYGAGTAYSNPSKFSELVEQGVVDLAFGAQQFEAGQFPLNLLISEPLMVSDAEKATRAYMKVLRSTPELAAEFGKNRVISVALAGPEQLHSRKQITSLEDMKGMRVLATNPGWSQVLRKLGASVVALPVSAAYENLQKGVIDAVSSSWQSLQAFKLFEVTSAHFEVNAVAPPVYFVVNEAKYHSLPAAARKVIDDFSSVEMAERFAAVWTVATVSAKAEAEKTGHLIVEISTPEHETLRRHGRLVADTRLAELEKGGLPAKRIYELFLKEVATEEERN